MARQCRNEACWASMYATWADCRLSRLLEQLSSDHSLGSAGRSLAETQAKVRGLARDPWTLAGFPFFSGEKKSRLVAGGTQSPTSCLTHWIWRVSSVFVTEVILNIEVSPKSHQ